MQLTVPPIIAPQIRQTSIKKILTLTQEGPITMTTLHPKVPTKEKMMRHQTYIPSYCITKTISPNIDITIQDKISMMEHLPPLPLQDSKIIYSVIVYKSSEPQPSTAYDNRCNLNSYASTHSTKWKALVTNAANTTITPLITSTLVNYAIGCKHKLKILRTNNYDTTNRNTLQTKASHLEHFIIQSEAILLMDDSTLC